jgi:peptidoglycan/xylan/chitin deacetylase (PgdA/CDA1 family)
VVSSTKTKRVVKVASPTVLAYHAITYLANDLNGSATSPERFKAQMLYLKRHNLQAVSIRKLRRATVAGLDTRKLVGLTFDDGYEDFMHTALPVLEELGFSATVFVVAGRLGGENDWHHLYEPRPRLRLLTAEALREVSGRGMEVGSHGMTHRQLLNLDPITMDREVNDSRRILSEILGEVVEGFSYPYGRFSYSAVEAVRRAGYAYACGWNACVWNDQDNRYDYNMSRIPVLERDHSLRFMLKMNIYTPYSKIVHRFRRSTAL